MNLDKLIEEAIYARSDTGGFETIELTEESLRQIIRQVLSYVKPDRDERVFPGINPGEDPVRETCYAQGKNETIDEMEARITTLGLEKTGTLTTYDINGRKTKSRTEFEARRAQP